MLRIVGKLLGVKVDSTPCTDTTRKRKINAAVMYSFWQAEAPQKFTAFLKSACVQFSSDSSGEDVIVEVFLI